MMTSLLLTCSEIYIYLSLFIYLDQHNKDMVRVLTEQVLRQRRKTNVLELSDHVIFFTYEIMVVVVLGLSTVYTRDNTRMVGLMLATLGHGFFSAIRIAFSPKLKDELRTLMSGFSKHISRARRAVRILIKLIRDTF